MYNCNFHESDEYNNKHIKDCYSNINKEDKPISKSSENSLNKCIEFNEENKPISKSNENFLNKCIEFNEENNNFSELKRLQFLHKQPKWAFYYDSTNKRKNLYDSTNKRKILYDTNTPDNCLPALKRIKLLNDDK